MGVQDECVISFFFFFVFNDPAATEIYTLSLHDALPIYSNLGLTLRLIFLLTTGCTSPVVADLAVGVFLAGAAVLAAGDTEGESLGSCPNLASIFRRDGDISSISPISSVDEGGSEVSAAAVLSAGNLPNLASIFRFDGDISSMFSSLIS